MREGAVHVTRRSCGHVTPLLRHVMATPEPRARAAQCLFLEDDLGALI